MTDLTPLLNEVLKRHDAPSTANTSLSLQHIDEFLKEAYRIVGVTCFHYNSSTDSAIRTHT